jgi:excisionase family DNA binding protein
VKDDILNKKQAAQYLKISVPTLDRLMKAKKIPYVKLNGRVLFLREALLDWLKNKQIFVGPDEAQKAIETLTDFLASPSPKKLSKEVGAAMKVVRVSIMRLKKEVGYLKKIKENI